MKRRTGLVLLGLLALGLLGNHLRWERQDGALLLRLDGVAHDPVGWLKERRDAWRDCSPVMVLAHKGPDAAPVLAAVQAFSPPDSHSAELRWLQRQGDWALAEVHFERLTAALVLLQHRGGQWSPVPEGIWSGSTAPWRSRPFVGRYLGQRVPEAPPPLLRCLPPLGLPFAAPD